MLGVTPVLWEMMAAESRVLDSFKPKINTQNTASPWATLKLKISRVTGRTASQKEKKTHIQCSKCYGYKEELLKLYENSM